MLALFQAATVFHLENGQSTFFWTDLWLKRSSIQTLAPNVFQTVKARKRKATVAEALHEFAWVCHIQGAITMQLLVEFAGLCDMLDQVQLSTELDTFLWGLGLLGSRLLCGLEANLAHYVILSNLLTKLLVVFCSVTR